MTTPLPWHAAALDQWRRYTASGNVPHALLLTGPRGVGKRRFADALAAGLLCQRTAAAANDSTACGECNACRQRLAGSHADLMLLERPEGKQQIAIDQVRECIQRLQLSSHAGGYKLLIIDEADRLNYAAANSLLKTLEEPTDKTLLILVSSSPQSLSATIRSRCQQLAIAAPSLSSAEQWMRDEGIGASPDDMAIALQVANRAPLEARQLLEDDYPEQCRRWRENWLKIVAGRADPVSLAEQWYRDEAEPFVGWLQHWSLALLQLASCGRSSAMFAGLEPSELERLKERTDAVALLRYYERHLQHAPRWLRGSANAQMQLEALLLAWVGKRIPVCAASSFS